MSALLDLVMLAAGIALLIGGGEGLVRGASGLARQLGVSPLAIGLTVVAFGTSAPELAVNVLAAIRGDTGVSFGNVVGSNIANVGLILGCAALVRPLEVQSAVIVREMPMMLVASAAALVLGLDRASGRAEVYDRGDGMALLLFFSIFLYYTIAEVLRGRRTDPLVHESKSATPPPGTTGFSVLLAVAGLLGLALGAEGTVRGAVSLAETLGVPRAIVGLTLVAVGTSLPELVTSVVAARRGQVDLAVGNVVGSNIFNLLFVLGVTSTIRPVAIPAGGVVDLSAMALFSAALLFLAATHGNRLVRWEGGVLLFAYLAYVVARVV